MSNTRVDATGQKLQTLVLETGSCYYLVTLNKTRIAARLILRAVRLVIT